jgi:PEP-CTERM motif
MASGSSGLWSFAATLPAAYQYSFQLQDCPNCVSEATWSYDYRPGGSFMLGDGTDTFNGTFTSGYGYGLGVESGPEYQALTLDMYFTGQWNTGLKQAGLMQLSETGQGGFPTGTATLSFGPAPEPGSLLLFGTGIVGLAGILRRRLLG